MVSPILTSVFQPRWRISPRELGLGCPWRSSQQELCWCPHWTLGPVWGSLGFGGIGIHSMGLRTRTLELVRPGALPHARAAVQLWTVGQPPWENHFLPCKMEALIQPSPWLVLRNQWDYWTCELLRPETDTEQEFSKWLSLGVMGSSENTARMLATPRLLMLETSCGVSEGGPGRRGR